MYISALGKDIWAKMRIQHMRPFGREKGLKNKENERG